MKIIASPKAGLDGNITNHFKRIHVIVCSFEVSWWNKTCDSIILVINLKGFAWHRGLQFIRLFLNVCGWETEPLKGSFSWTMVIRTCWLLPLSLIYSARARALWVAIKAFIWSALIRRETMTRIPRASSAPRETPKHTLFNSHIWYDIWWHAITASSPVWKNHLLLFMGVILLFVL